MYSTNIICSCDQAAQWMVLSAISLSACLLHTFYNVPTIVSSWNFQKSLPIAKTDIDAKGQGQRSKVKVT